jgi:hypothetical protein
LPTTDDQKDTNEIIAETIAAIQQRAAAAASTASATAKRWPLATIGLGIGSAAVVAALLYANRHRKK